MAALFSKEIPLFLKAGKPWPPLQPLLCVLPEFGFNGKAAAGAAGSSTKGVCVCVYSHVCVLAGKHIYFDTGKH